MYTSTMRANILFTKTLENLLVAQNVLRPLKSNVVSSEEDVEAANALYAWLARISLPAAEFADSLEAAYSDNSTIHVFFPAP